MTTRRAFITLLGGAAGAWPLAARAQQRERMRRIGILMNLTADDPQGQTRVAAFLQGLQESGWAVARNLQIDIRWGDRDAERNRKKRGGIGRARAGRYLGNYVPHSYGITTVNPRSADLLSTIVPIFFQCPRSVRHCRLEDQRRVRRFTARLGF
jgi:hypothetical protein